MYSTMFFRFLTLIFGGLVGLKLYTAFFVGFNASFTHFQTRKNLEIATSLEIGL